MVLESITVRPAANGISWNCFEDGLLDGDDLDRPIQTSRVHYHGAVWSLTLTASLSSMESSLVLSE